MQRVGPISGSILPFVQPPVGPTLPAESLGPEENEVPVKKRNVITITAMWIGVEDARVRAWQDAHYYCEYPDGTTEGTVTIKGTSWWNVLRQIHADLIRTGRISEPPGPN